jgi:hypothetical protein
MYSGHADLNSSESCLDVRRPEIAALRDFDAAYVRLGVNLDALAAADAAIHVRFASNSDQGGKSQ